MIELQKMKMTKKKVENCEIIAFTSRINVETPVWLLVF